MLRRACTSSVVVDEQLCIGHVSGVPCGRVSGGGGGLAA